MLAVLDYGAGNLWSVTRALTQVGCDFEVTCDPQSVASSSGIILPGVGAAADMMAGLSARNLVKAIRTSIGTGRPYLGICMGMQVLFESSEEDGGTACLNVYTGKIRRFSNQLQVPHMGWNQVLQRDIVPILEGIPQDTNFYFAHSYHAPTDDDRLIGATTHYGTEFLSILHDGNVFGTQFHPEKSGVLGLKIYTNFARLCNQATNKAT